MAGKSGGWNPNDASNGETPVAEEVRQLWVYSIHGRCSLQVV